MDMLETKQGAADDGQREKKTGKRHARRSALPLLVSSTHNRTRPANTSYKVASSRRPRILSSAVAEGSFLAQSVPVMGEHTERVSALLARCK